MRTAPHSVQEMDSGWFLDVAVCADCEDRYYRWDGLFNFLLRDLAYSMNVMATGREWLAVSRLGKRYRLNVFKRLREELIH